MSVERLTHLVLRHMTKYRNRDHPLIFPNLSARFGPLAGLRQSPVRGTEVNE